MSDDIDVSMMEMGTDYGDQVSEDPFDDVIEEGEFSENMELSESDEPESEIEESSEQEEDDGEVESEDVEEGEEPSEEKSDDGEKEDESESEPEEAEEEGEIDYQKRVDELNQKLEDGSLEIKINEEDTATLQDLKNSFIGQKEISRRFSEVDVEKKAVEKDVEEINGYISEFAGKLKDGDSVGAMQYFGEFAGIPPYMVKEQLIAALKPEIIRREQMSATEVQNEYLSSQNDYLQSQSELNSERLEKEQAQVELSNQINTIRENHQIDENTWDAYSKAVEETLEEGEQLTPELVEGAIISGRHYEQAESIVNSFEGKLDDLDEWVEQMVTVQEKYPDFSEEELKGVLSTAVESMQKESVETKLAEKIEKKSPSRKQTKQKAQPEEDLDPDLEDWL